MAKNSTPANGLKIETFLQFEKETPNKARYMEITADGKPVVGDELTVSTIYLPKSKLGAQRPGKFKVTIEAVG